MTNKINCSKRPEVGHTWLQWIKNSKQEIQNKSPTKNPQIKPPQYKLQDDIYAGLGKLSF